MELLQLKYFCDAAQTQNFSMTAKKYFVPTSNISQSIKRLENELGCELFEHRKNKILLNDEGKLFYENVSQALALLEGAKENIRDSGNVLQGEIKILCLCSRSVISRAIERFSQVHPQINFVLHHDLNAQLDFDILISDISPFAYGKKILLADEEICIAVNKNHPLAQKAQLSVEELEQERFISMTAGNSMHTITMNACADAGFVPNIAIQTNDPFYVRKYVELGMGIAFVPTFSWKGIFPENIRLKSVGNIRRRTYAYLPKNKHIKKSVEGFLNILKTEISNTM